MQRVSSTFGTCGSIPSHAYKSSSRLWGGGVALLSWILPLHIFHKLVARHEALWYEVCCDSGGLTMFIQ